MVNGESHGIAVTSVTGVGLLYFPVVVQGECHASDVVRSMKLLHVCHDVCLRGVLLMEETAEHTAERLGERSLLVVGKSHEIVIKKTAYHRPVIVRNAESFRFIEHDAGLVKVKTIVKMAVDVGLISLGGVGRLGSEPIERIYLQTRFSDADAAGM